jgi:predicted nucleotide-binding protein (sugar kinase/HSP70/actin superfamily)
LEREGIHFDRPTISFKDRSLLKKGTWNYLKGLGIPKKVFGPAFEKAVAEQDLFRKEVRDRSSDIVKGSRDRGSLVVLLLGRPYHIDHLINHKITEMITQFGADVITEDSVPVSEEGIDSVQVLTQWEYPNRIYNAVKWASHQENVEVVQLNSFGCGPDALVYDEARSILTAAGKGHTLIRIDEVSSPGSIKLRLRSMFESLEERGSRGGLLDRKRTTTPPYTDADTHRKLLVPYFSRFFSPILESALRSIGFDIETLPEPDRSSIEIGLKYCNNDICYPAIVTIGDLLKAVKTGKYDTDRIALGITQTGGQCRASSYVSLLKKAILTAGYDNIPVVTVSLSSKKLNEQPGLKIDWRRMLSRMLHGAVFADGLMEMYYSTAPREERKGASNELVDIYLGKARDLFKEGRHSELPELLEKAVMDFNAVPVMADPIPVIGIVGEIYVKYNSFGNFRVVDHLIENGIEPVVPPIFEFFSQELLNHRIHAEYFTKYRTAKYYLSYPAEWYVRYFLRQYDRVSSQYVRHRPRHAIGDLADDAKGIVSLVSQFGEGWLIPAEISAFAKDGITNVLCLQPFGCISNHIIGKGIENALKRAHPELNILYLDMDAGSSEVNIYNRLNFMMRSSREDLERKAEGIRT